MSSDRAPVPQPELPASSADPVALPTTGALRPLLSVTVALLLCTLVRPLSFLLAPVLLALFVTMNLRPLARKIEARLPRPLVSVALVVVVYGALLGVALLVVVCVARFVTLLAQNLDRVGRVTDGLTQWLVARGIDGSYAQSAVSSISPERLLTIAGSISSVVSSVASNVVLLAALLFFMVLDSRPFSGALGDVLGRRIELSRVAADLVRSIQVYSRVATAFGLLIAVLDLFLLLIAGVPSPVLWAMLAFVTNYIPNLGFVIGLVPPAVLALVIGGPGPMLVVIIGYSVINLVVQGAVQPAIMGGQVSLSSSITFIALIFWTWVLGPLGAILALPLTLTVRAIFIDAFPGRKWVRRLLGEQQKPRTKKSQPGHGEAPATG